MVRIAAGRRRSAGLGSRLGDRIRHGRHLGGGARGALRAAGHALAFFVMLLAAAVWGVVRMGGDYPGWFCAGLVLTLPLQGWVGMKLALLGRRGS